jgi:hypothetical protein
VIATKSAAAKKEHEATLAKARQDIDKFYEEYAAKKAKQHAKNKEIETAAIKVRDELASAKGNIWDRVVAYIDFNTTTSSVVSPVTSSSTNSQSKDGKKAAAPAPPEPKKDLSRFKGMLLQLKNDPKAPGNTV